MNKFIYTCIFFALCYNSDTFNSSNKINFVNGHYNSSENNIVKVNNNKFIAMGMSFIVPGTGQIYQGNLEMEKRIG